MTQAAYLLFPKQMQAMRHIFVDDVNQLLYGGAAGGGKSGFIRALAFHTAHVWPGGRIAIFRDNYTQLRKNQVSKWIAEMSEIGFTDTKKFWREDRAEWTFPNPYGSEPTVVEFLHLDQSIGAEKWLSTEWAAICVDEATQIGEDDHALLYSRVRTTTAVEGMRQSQQELWTQLADEREAQARAAGIEDPDDIKMVRSDWHPLAVYATNPGGVSHAYFKGKFVDAAPPGTVFDVSETLEVGTRTIDVNTRRVFLRSYLSDNPHIDEYQYSATLAHIPKARREQLMNGDWEYFEGKIFDMLREETHYVDADKAFGGKPVPPKDWVRLGGLDHGTANPTAAHWITMDEDGFFIIYQEYYSPGPVQQHINEINMRRLLDGKHDTIFEADPRMWHGTRGSGHRIWSVADEYAYAGEPPEDTILRRQALMKGVRLHQSNVEREAGWMALQRMFEPDPNRMFPDWHPRAGEFGAPKLFISHRCPELWREANAFHYKTGTDEAEKIDDHSVDSAYRAAVAFEQAVAAMSRGTYTPRATISYVQRQS